jgi:hypothetical protein
MRPDILYPMAAAHVSSLNVNAVPTLIQYEDIGYDLTAAIDIVDPWARLKESSSGPRASAHGAYSRS